MTEILNGLASRIAEEHGITPPDFGDDDHDNDHNKDQPMHDDIRRLFDGALATQRLTFADAEHPERLTRQQREGLDWVYRYTRSQAERIAREREVAAEPRLSEAEMAEFWATL